MQPLADDLLKLLVCPRDKEALRQQSDWLCCPSGHRYRIVDGIPILLVSEAQQTHIEGTRALAVAEEGDAAQLPQFHVGPGEIDPFVKAAIGATNGSLYQHLVGKLTEYPVPALRLPAGKGRSFLEIGCSWGRWCLAAARSGYRPVGIDPSLKGIRAARRVAQQLGIQASYLVADGRYLPFPDSIFDQVFSYSVLQHLSKENSRSVLSEIHRVLTAGGQSLIQLPNVFGIRCLYHQVRRGLREARDFEVRYWTVPELRRTFETAIGPASVEVDGFFSLNAQISDLRFFPWRYKALIRLSQGLQRLATHVPPVIYFADSLYVTASKSKAA
ncbi:MAG: methyltransferase domain-containing protein [Terriglobales bacterium]